MGPGRRLLLVAAIALACDGGAPEAPAAGRPNIVLIVLDDLDYEDLGAYGNEQIDTPQLDRLAAQGTRFTQYYASSPVCSPTRAAILTGLEPARLGLRQIVRRSSRRGIPRRIPTLGELLRDAGYATATSASGTSERGGRSSCRPPRVSSAVCAGGPRTRPRRLSTPTTSCSTTSGRAGVCSEPAT